MQKIALVLCGAGRFDGSEIHESTLALFHLESLGFSSTIYAPSGEQWATCDHFNGNATPNEARNMLSESARISRGQVCNLNDLQVDEYDALFLPGGAGAAKNLCDFAAQGGNGEVFPPLNHIIRAFHSSGKPIAAICIAPAIIALAIGDQKPVLTIGNCEHTAAEVSAAGGEMVECGVGEVAVDYHNNLLSTPAYMLAQSIAEVDAGISALCQELKKMLNLPK